jgi:hypothetical protein
MTWNEVILNKQNFLLLTVSSHYPVSTSLRRHLFLNSWKCCTASDAMPHFAAAATHGATLCRQGPRKTSVITTAAIGSDARLEHPARARNCHVIVQQPCACRASARGLQQQLCQGRLPGGERKTTLSPMYSSLLISSILQGFLRNKF